MTDTIGVEIGPKGSAGSPVLRLSLHWPMNGAWSAELQAASDATFSVGDIVTLRLPTTLALVGRVSRAELSSGRWYLRATGGRLDWGQPIDLKHYRKTNVDQVLADLGLAADLAPIDVDLPFWLRKASTIGEAVQQLAGFLQVNWRILESGALRIRAEDAAPSDVLTSAGDSVEIFRDGARGIVEVAVDAAVIEPGVAFGSDLVGDVQYEVGGDGEPLRCRYYTQQRAALRGVFERLVRWVTRDALFLGQYSAVVQRQAPDGTLDVLPDDPRLAAGGLQSVPIRHGMPGVQVRVPVGGRVLLGFDAGDSRQPYCALWHAGQVTEVQIGGASAVALAELVSQRLAAMQIAIDTHLHTSAAPGSPTTPPTPPIVWPTDQQSPISAEVLKCR